MDILQSRNKYYARTTIGKVSVDGMVFGNTLEDTCRPYGVKVYGETAIPENTTTGYNVGIHYSPRFKRKMLILYTEEDKITLRFGGVEFKYIYIHGMNTHKDTEGCIGVAEGVDNNTIYKSLEKELFNIVSKRILAGETVKWFIKNSKQEG